MIIDSYVFLNTSSKATNQHLCDIWLGKPRCDIWLGKLCRLTALTITILSSFKFMTQLWISTTVRLQETNFLGLFENLLKPCLGSCSVDLLRIPDAKMRKTENRKWRRVLHGSQVTWARWISSNAPDGFCCKYRQYVNWESNGFNFHSTPLEIKSFQISRDLAIVWHCSVLFVVILL